MPGEKPLFWVGSAKADLLEFPEPVKDGVGIALSVPSLGASTHGPNLGKARGRECSKWLKISEAIRSGRFTQCVLKGQSTYFTPFRKSHGAVLRQPSQILS
jgi:hypothetical protein